MRDEFRALTREKFRNWKRCFLVFFFSYAFSFVIGTVLFRVGLVDFLLPVFSRMLNLFAVGFIPSFKILLLSLVPLFILFTSGPTIYAPLSAFVTVNVSGALSGVESAYLMRSGKIALSLFETIFSSSSGYFMIIYATMVTLTALRIFTDTKKGSSPQLFEGSLFCAGGFRGIFNYRYILSYVGFYIFISLTTSIVVLVRAVAASLF